MKFVQPQSIRTVFFDAGFTLLYPHPSIPEICQQISQKLDLHIHLEQVEQRMNGTEDFYFRQSHITGHTWADDLAINEYWISYYMMLLRPLLEEHDEPRLYQLAHAINQEFAKHTNWRLYADVVPILEILRANEYSLGIISDWGIALAPILHNMDLTKYFDCLLISATVRQAKPSPRLYELALQRANAIPDYTLHIGDSYTHDVLGARAVGITPVLLDRSSTLDENNVDCLLVHSLYELLDLLEVERP